MATVKCPAGWLVVPAETGDDYVPFFVQVRGSDIHWKESNALKSSLSAMTESGVDTVERIEPNTMYRIDRGSWLIDVQSDGLVTATTQMSITNDFTFTNDSCTVLSTEVELPLFIRENNNFNIQITLSSADDYIQYATANVERIGSTVMINGNTVSGYNSFKLNLNSFIYRFGDDFVRKCKDSRIFITVRGNIPVTEYEV